MKRDLNRLFGVFYAFERKNNKREMCELRDMQEQISKKIRDKELKGLFNKYIAKAIKREYEQERRLVAFVYDYFDMFYDE